MNFIVGMYNVVKFEILHGVCKLFIFNLNIFYNSSWKDSLIIYAFTINSIFFIHIGLLGTEPNLV